MVAAAVAAAAFAPAQFRSRPGWRSGSVAAHACPGVSPKRCTQATTWAATARWRDCVECLPHRTVERLPADGIAMQIGVAVEHPVRQPDRLEWPPRLQPDQVAAPFEGLPSRIGVLQRSGRVGGYEVSIMVFFGRPTPTPRQLARARAELAAAVLPR